MGNQSAWYYRNPRFLKRDYRLVIKTRIMKKMSDF